MTLTTKVRFTEPIDPRKVWAQILQLINPPTDYQWSHIPSGGNPIAYRNPLIFAEPDQGSDAWAYVRYGQEGSRLARDDDDTGPDGYAEATFIGSHTDRDRHQTYIAALAAAAPAAVQDDYTGQWSQP
jgi:hypothetical protein